MVQYIPEMERKICKIISEIFSGLCKALDIVIMDTGKYGFVKMQYDEEEPLLAAPSACCAGS